MYIFKWFLLCNKWLIISLIFFTYLFTTINVKSTLANQPDRKYLFSTRAFLSLEFQIIKLVGTLPNVLLNTVSSSLVFLLLLPLPSANVRHPCAYI